VLVECPGERADGLVVALPADALARADYYEELFGYTRRPCHVETGDGPERVEAWRPAEQGGEAGGVWRLEDWQQRHAALTRLAAEDVMALRAERPAAETARRLPMIRARAQARLNAAAGGPTTLRHATRPGDLEILARRTPYAGFFAVEEYDLRHARFAGGLSPEMTRAAFVGADAVTVLPYDAARDRVLVIEQFRAGPLARGDAQLWSIEAIAGRIDPGETPEDTARREADEEAGLALGALIRIAGYYPSPGAKTEYIHSYLGLADLPDGAAGLGGVAGENEDIRAHVIPFARLLELAGTGEVNNAPLLLSAMHLAERRPSLRASARGAAPS
jgi:nudix-type nucleoside diphosphatase (YffH/AdpP family)